MRDLNTCELNSISGGLLSVREMRSETGPTIQPESVQDLDEVTVTANVSDSDIGDPFALWGYMSTPVQGPPGEYDTIGQGDDPESDDWSATGEITVDTHGGPAYHIHIENDQNNVSADGTVGYDTSNDNVDVDVVVHYNGMDLDYSKDFQGEHWSGGYTWSNGIHLSIGQQVIRGHQAVNMTIDVPLN